jgi:phage terminase large subunit-like protein
VIDFARDVLEIELLPWQQWLFIHGLELNEDDSYRFKTLLVLVSRQCGKTTALMVLALWRMVMDGARMVLGTSTNLDYAKEAWQKAANIAWGPKDAQQFAGAPELEGVFTQPRYANGQEELSTVDGARYKIGTATRTGGRSLSLDLVIMDELREHKTWLAWSAASKTTNARPRGQRWALSNMGDDTSVVLNHFQALGRAAIANPGTGDRSMALFEWSAPEGCATDDRSVWPLAVPALGYTISEETVAADELSDPEEVFRTEVLCQRVPTLDPLPITLQDWLRAAVRNEPKIATNEPVFGVSVSPSLKSAAISVARRPSPGYAYLELSDYRDGDINWLVPRLIELADKYPKAKFALMGTGAAASLLPDLVEAKVEPEQMTTTALGKAYGNMHTMLMERRLTHSGAPPFEQALVGAVKRDVGEGLWSLGWRKSHSDIAPIEAGALALWLLVSGVRRVPKIF